VTRCPDQLPAPTGQAEPYAVQERHMAHVAISEADSDGEVVTWLAHVTDPERAGD
jgi:hypothetical protein